MKLFKNKIFIACLCLLVAAAIAFGLVPTINSRTRDVETVVRVKKVIPENTLITADMLTTVEIGTYGNPADIVKDAKSIVGQYSAVELLPSDNLILAKFKPTQDLQDSRLYSLEEKKLAVSVTIKNLAASLSGKLQVGDVVSVYAALRGGATGMEDTIKLYPELELVEVAAVTNAKAINTNTQDSNTEANKDIIPATVTLIVNPAQARRLIEIENCGSVHIAFVGRGDVAKAKLAAFIPPDPSEYEVDPNATIESESEYGDYLNEVDSPQAEQETTVSETEGE